MVQQETGVLPAQSLRRLIHIGCVKGVSEKYVNPASIDLPLSAEVYRLEGIFLPRRGEKVRSLIKSAGGVRYDLKNPLEVGVPYLVRVEGTFELPLNVYGYINPKSSTGRINLLCRIIADGVAMYDALIGHGWKGEIWVLIRAESFPVLLTPGQAVSQLRLFDGKTFLDEFDLNLAIKEHVLFYHPDGKQFRRDEVHHHQNSLLLSLRVERKMAGWECRGTSKVLDYGKIGHYRPEDFFTQVEVKNSHLELLKDSFYILGTYEHVVVPPELSAELRAIDPRFGEFRSHSAGYIDPGWGWGKDGSVHGRPITLEVTPHERMRVSHRQTFIRIRYEHMKHVPDVPYDAGNPNYAKQTRGATLSKHFAKR